MSCKIVALTGRSGSGKSEVGRILTEAGAAVIDADVLTRSVYQPHSACLAALASRFGEDILDANGALRRRALAEKAFASAEGVQALTDCTHPFILEALQQAIRQKEAQGETLVFVDGAVIVDAPFEAYCDAIVVVDAEESCAVRRIMQRDDISEQAARERLSRQITRERLLQKADYVVPNTGDISALKQQTLQMLRHFRVFRKETE